MKAQIARWTDRLRRAGGMKGPAELEVLEDLRASVLVDDLTTSPYRWVSRDFLATARFDLVAAAGQFPTTTISFQDPLYLCWVRRLVLASTVNQAVELGWDTGLTGVNQNLVSRDQRADRGVTFLEGMVTSSESSQAGNIAPADLWGSFRVLANDTIDLNLDLIIDGDGVGRGVTAQGVAAASGIIGWWEFEIFQREPSER